MIVRSQEVGVGGGAKLRRGENEESDWGRVQNGMEKVPGCAVIP